MAAAEIAGADGNIDAVALEIHEITQLTFRRYHPRPKAA
jgi:hypothetical protein